MHIDQPDTSIERLVTIWVLKLFTSNFTYKELATDNGYSNDRIAEYLNLPKKPTSEMLAKEIPDMMAAMLVRLEDVGAPKLDKQIQKNLDQFCGSLGLNQVESAILTFFLISEEHSIIKDCIQCLDKPLLFKTGLVLSPALGFSEAEITAAFRMGSQLMSTGVMKKEEDDSHFVPYRFKWGFFSQQVAHQLLTEPYDEGRILVKMGIFLAEAPRLTLTAYPHLKELPMLIEYLRESLHRDKKGVNILLHGDPGTGKTQMTRVVAAELEVTLFDFATEDHHGDPIKATRRLTNVRMASCLFKDSPALFVFDEFEDILSDSRDQRGKANEHKGWFNRLLENNPRPIFWLSNSIDFLDAAFVRRFDFIIELPIPPRAQRAVILQTNAGRHLSSHAIERLVAIESLAPAVVSRVSDVFDLLPESLSPAKRDELFCHMAGSILKAQGHEKPRLAVTEILPREVYDTSCLNTDADLPSLARMLRDHPHARICLYGPPGTGKTAFGHWLAREIDRPLHLKRASDLLSPFVGQTEVKIAGTFEKAFSDDAILMIDEVDSFLQDRAKAVHSWEVTQVNELLTLMESFSGVFIATTNRIEHLDAASLRRFDLKLYFDYLNRSQIQHLLGAWCCSLGISSAGDEHHSMIESMECVTPGDFASVARRHRFQPFADASQFLHALKDDCAMKTETARRIGFQTH